MATYNCTDSANNAYGAGGFGTCDGQLSTIPGAPNTGFFMQQAFASPAAIIVIPLVTAIIVTAAAILVIKLKKRAAKASR